MTNLLASVAMSEHLPAARESAQRTYDRRRARRAAGMLAEIPPNRWDAETKRIIATLATIAAPSRIDDMLEAFDGQPADHAIEIVGTFRHTEPRDECITERPCVLEPGHPGQHVLEQEPMHDNGDYRA